MKLVGDRLNLKKQTKKRSRQILDQHAAEPWKSLPRDAGVSEMLHALDTHKGKRKSSWERVGKRHPSLAQEVLELLGKIFWGKHHCNLNLLSYISCRDAGREEARGSSSQVQCQMFPADPQLKSPWTQAWLQPNVHCSVDSKAQLQNQVPFWGWSHTAMGFRV